MLSLCQQPRIRLLHRGQSHSGMNQEGGGSTCIGVTQKSDATSALDIFTVSSAPRKCSAVEDLAVKLIKNSTTESNSGNYT